jgi:hypothetical protein
MFRVVWLKVALDELAECWLRADSDGRQSISQAADQIEEALRDDPMDEGESRSGGDRVTFASTLGLLFHVDETSQLVRVLQVWTVRGRR